MSNQTTPVQFTGKAGEYFGIWIVNLLLSIITLGVYSAWAKVRRKKYFYNNTHIDNVAFDYHAKPIAILKGRIVAVVVFILYNLLSAFSPILGGILAIVFIVALPWIVIRGLMFNARNSSHRGLRFDFNGKYGQAALAFIGYPLLIVFTLGLALPFAMQRIQQFMFNHHKFGATAFDMQAKVKDFYMVYLKLLGFFVALGIVFAILAKSLLPSTPSPAPSLGMHHPYQATLVPATYQTNTVGGFIKVAATEEAAIEAAAADATAEAADAAANAASSEEDALKNLTAEERAEYEAQMKAFEEQYANGTYSQESEEAPAEPANPLGDMFGTYAAMLGPIFYVLIAVTALMYIAAIFAVTAYVHSRISNLVWNNTKLDHIQFISNQRMRDLIWLYFSNGVVLILTLGLATPWAQIRMARYRCERLALAGEADWDKFVGEKKEHARAMGEEIADMFDVDLSFG